MSVVTPIYLVSSAISLVAAVAAWRRRDVRGGRALALMLMAATLWAACDAIEVNLATSEGRRFASQVQYLGVVAAAPFFFHLAVALSRREALLTRPVVVVVWLVPLASLLVAWTSAWHSWLWTSIELPSGQNSFAIYHYGPWFWVLAVQHDVLMALGTLMLLQTAARVRRPYRRGMVVVAAAMGLIWLGNFIYIFKLGPYPGLNWGAASLGISVALLAWVVLDEGLFDLLPRPDRSHLLDLMSDGVLVVDRNGRSRLLGADRGLPPLASGGGVHARHLSGLRGQFVRRSAGGRANAGTLNHTSNWTTSGAWSLVPTSRSTTALVTES